MQLPETFYLYETKQPCPDCRGCVENYHQEITEKSEGKVHQQNQEGITANSKPSEASLEPVFGSKSSTFSLFAVLSSNNSGTSGITGGSGPFPGAGAALFGEKEKEGYNEDNYDPQYKAIVQVTKLDNIKTGEEDDEIIFKHRAKLYRFDKQWKDRGIGDIKLTKNAKTGYCRVIMRRDIVYKLCANHAIMPNMELNMLESSDRSWIWFTPSDYSEGLPPQPQQFCVKFKNKQVATEFKTRFEELKLVMDELLKAEKLNEEKSFETEPLLDNQPAETARDEKEIMSTTEDFATKFGLKEGQWECSVCLVKNEKIHNACVSCNASKNNFSTLSESKNEMKFCVDSTENNATKFSFGLPQTEGISFGTSNSDTFKFSSSKESQPLLEGIKESNTNIPSPNLFNASSEDKIRYSPFNLTKNQFVNNSSFKFVVPGAKANPKKFSDPVSLTFENRDQTPMVYALKEGHSKFSEPLFGKVSSLGTKNKTKDLSPGPSNLLSPDLTAVLDRELMPPPKDIPIETNRSPKQDGTEKDQNSISSWMPKGLSADHLFSFVATPSPTLSPTSSVDDIPATSFAIAPSAFPGATFSFKFETPAELSVTKETKSPELTSLATLEKKLTTALIPSATLTKVEAETGEEQEKVMFCKRTKMFRFDSQWKDRGVGEIKILKHKDSGLFRLIMRRDRTHKLCANHRLINGMQIKPMSGNNKKAYVWKTNADASDDKGPRDQIYAARFKDEEIAERFSEIFTLACKMAKLASNDTGDSKEASGAAAPYILQMASKRNRTSQVIEMSENKEEREKPSLPNGVSLTDEPTISDDVKEKTKQLLLPKSFYHTPSENIGKNRPSKTKAGR